MKTSILCATCPVRHSGRRTHGTSSAENEVKMLSDRKADREGHVADIVADGMFRFTLDTRFRRRGEPQARNVSSPLTFLTE